MSFLDVPRPLRHILEAQGRSGMSIFSQDLARETLDEMHTLSNKCDHRFLACNRITNWWDASAYDGVFCGDLSLAYALKSVAHLKGEIGILVFNSSSDDTSFSISDDAVGLLVFENGTDTSIFISEFEMQSEMPLRENIYHQVFSLFDHNVLGGKYVFSSGPATLLDVIERESFGTVCLAGSRPHFNKHYFIDIAYEYV